MKISTNAFKGNDLHINCKFLHKKAALSLWDNHTMKNKIIIIKHNEIQKNQSLRIDHAKIVVVTSSIDTIYSSS